LAGKIDAAAEVARDHSRQHALHLLLDRGLLGAIGPFHHRAEPRAALVADRARDGAEDAAAELSLGRARGGEGIELAALAGRVARERLEARAAKLLRLEAGQAGADLALVAPEGGVRRVVEIDDPVLRVGEHHRGRYLVERLADAGILRGHQPLVL